MSDNNPCAAAGVFFAAVSAAGVLITSAGFYSAGFKRGVRAGFAAGVHRTALTFRRIIDAAAAREYFPRGTVSGAVADILGQPKPKPKRTPKPKPKRTAAGGSK